MNYNVVSKDQVSPINSLFLDESKVKKETLLDLIAYIERESRDTIEEHIPGSSTGMIHILYNDEIWKVDYANSGCLYYLGKLTSINELLDELSFTSI